MIIFAWVFLYTVPYVFKLQYYSLERGVVFYLIGAYIRTEVDIENIRKFRFQLIVSFFFYGRRMLHWAICSTRG